MGRREEVRVRKRRREERGMEGEEDMVKEEKREMLNGTKSWTERTREE